MPAGIHPIAPASVKRTSISNAAANTARDGTGTITAVIATAGANGAVVPSVKCRTGVAAGVASTAMVARLWHQLGGSGSFFLLDEVALTSVTPSGTAIATEFAFPKTNIAIGALDKLLVTQSIAEAVYYTADQGDY